MKISTAQIEEGRLGLGADSPSQAAASAGAYTVNASGGAGLYSVPIDISRGRAGFQPTLNLAYQSGGGNSVFGLGWDLSLGRIYRRTSKGVPTYDDDADVFVHSGLGEILPMLDDKANELVTTVGDIEYRQFTPRTSRAPFRIEQLRDRADGSVTFRVISGDNVTYTFGSDDSSRISSRGRIFAWLLDSSFDAHGNAVLYSYVAENASGVDVSSAHEANREAEWREANRYIASIRYGNSDPNRGAETWEPFHPSTLPPAGWLFEIVFDYGQLPQTILPSTVLRYGPDGWVCRPDPFSTYSSGFELRTYRLCSRILMFHHFPQELGRQDTLIASTDLTYSSAGGISTLVAIQKKGYCPDPSDPDALASQAMPPVRFGYAATVAEITPKAGVVEAEHFSHLPPQFVDLHGDGVPGFLSREPGAWYFRPNASQPGSAGSDPAGRDWYSVSELPAHFADGFLFDLDADGLVDLVRLEGNSSGFYARETTGDWSPFRSFRSSLQSLPSATVTRFADLTGDGKVDVLSLQDEFVAWSRSLGPDGFAETRLAFAGTGEQDGPRVLSSTVGEAVIMVDMTGDGLADLVRVRNGQVSYWPSLGHGAFGRQVIMDGSPVMDAPDLFDTARLFLADVDGNGGTDLLYLAPEGVALYLNQAGNSFSSCILLDGIPPLDTMSSVDIVDLHGKGTKCIAWTSSTTDRLFYLDLSAGTFPRLLTTIDNGLGLTTTLSYAPSTRYMAEDKFRSRPWARKLAMPIACIARVERRDVFTRCRHIETYRYRHGYYDRAYREFCGFGMVEKRSWDELVLDPSAQAADMPSYSTPADVTRAWYSTGELLSPEDVISVYSRDFYILRDGPFRDHSVHCALINLDVSSGPDEVRDGLRAFRGQLLRLEEYMDDGSAGSDISIRITSRSATAKQTRRHVSFDRPAAFSVVDRESFVVILERQDIGDYRASQDLVLRADAYADVTKSISVSYGRQPTQGDFREVQSTTLAVVTQTEFTNAIVTASAFRCPQVAETTKNELVGLMLITDNKVLDASAIDSIVARLSTLDVADFGTDTYRPSYSASLSQPQRRLLSHQQRIYYKDDLGSTLDVGTVGVLGLLSHSRSLALPGSLVNSLFKEKAELVGHANGLDGILLEMKYTLDEEGNWWQPSPSQLYLKRVGDSLLEARKRFFSPVGNRDPFGSTTSAELDRYNLFPRQITNELEHQTEITADYRSLKPLMIKDANQNWMVFAYDVFGRSSTTALVGKSETLDAGHGEANVQSEAQLKLFLEDPVQQASALLGSASSFTLRSPAAVTLDSSGSDGSAWEATIVQRERPPPDGNAASGIDIVIRHFGGRGQVLQTKSLVDSDVVKTTASKSGGRWLTSPWVISTAEGLPKKRYEAWISDSPGPVFRPHGEPETLFWDPLGRNLGQLNRDHSWTKTEHTPWLAKAYDSGDTALADPPSDRGLASYISALCEPAEYTPTWHGRQQPGSAQAEQDKIYNDTPRTTHLNAAGRAFAVDEQATATEHLVSLHLSDIQGYDREHRDPRGIRIQYDTVDMLGRVCQRQAADSGNRLTLYDAMGRKSWMWDNKEFLFGYHYDAIGRLVIVSQRDAETGLWNTIEAYSYDGEGTEQPAQRNLLGQPYQIRDQSGVVTFTARDSLYKVTAMEQRLAVRYDGFEDVNAPGRKLDDAVTTLSTYDLLGRPLSVQTESASTIEYKYSYRGLLTGLGIVLPQGQAVDVVRSCSYNARGQKTLVEYGNGVTVDFSYNDATYRLMRRVTTKRQGEDVVLIEDARYERDIQGYILSMTTAPPHSSLGLPQTTTMACRYQYDALGHLIRASGWELPKRDVVAPGESAGSTIAVGEAASMVPYKDSFDYDASGNIIEIDHSTEGGSQPWLRKLEYAGDSNRITQTDTAAGDTNPTVQEFTYDAHGNTTGGEDLLSLGWNCYNQLAQIKTRVGGLEAAVHFVYDQSSERSRVLRAVDGNIAVDEKSYRCGLSVKEIHRSSGGSERSTMQLIRFPPRMARHDPVAVVVETTTGAVRLRYQLSNHVDSVSIELDGDGQLLSVQDFSSFGTATAAARGSGAAEAPYGFSGKARDEFSGLLYYSKRYYAPWLGRWMSPDPIGITDGLNVYGFVSGNPVNFVDPTGTMEAPDDGDDRDHIPFDLEDINEAVWLETQQRQLHAHEYPALERLRLYPGRGEEVDKDYIIDQLLHIARNTNEWLELGSSFLDVLTHALFELYPDENLFEGMRQQIVDQHPDLEHLAGKMPMRLVLKLWAMVTEKQQRHQEPYSRRIEDITRDLLDPKHLDDDHTQARVAKLRCVMALQMLEPAVVEWDTKHRQRFVDRETNRRIEARFPGQAHISSDEFSLIEREVRADLEMFFSRQVWISGVRAGHRPTNLGHVTTPEELMVGLEYDYNRILRRGTHIAKLQGSLGPHLMDDILDGAKEKELERTNSGGGHQVKSLLELTLRSIWRNGFRARARGHGQP